MTNKPMLSVELRALLERASNNLCSGEEAYSVQQELRALLDEPDETFNLQGWSIDHSAGRPILMHNKCSVIEAEQAYGLLNLIETAAQNQGDPVAWRYKKSWEKTGWKVCDNHPTDYGIDDECYEIQALYAEQPAPVADQAQCEECKGWGYHENHHEGGGTECGECGGSGNATVAVAVVMPDRMKVEPFTTIDLGSKNYKAGYNAAIAEVAKLNGLNP